MSEPLRCVSSKSIIVSWDFSTSGVKCLAFDLSGRTVGEVRLPTDIWTEGGVSELNLMQLEGQARASTRAITRQLRAQDLLSRWVAGGISATHHSAGRIDQDYVQVRRAICWNDHSLAAYHAKGLERLGGQEQVIKMIGGPWAIRYTLSHLVKDEETLAAADWRRTHRIFPHGPLAAGYLTGNFDVISMSSAASTGIMNLRTGKWAKGMLNALANPAYRKLAWEQLPTIGDMNTPLGQLSASLCQDISMSPRKAPWIFPTNDDQQAGLAGGGAVDAGQVAVILGKSAVVNSSSHQLPAIENLDAMRLNWGPYLWMRCYNNGAQFLDAIIGENPNWKELEQAARRCPPGANGHLVLPFVQPEPSLGVQKPRLQWLPRQPEDMGTTYRACLEALAYLMALGVRAHEEAGQRITRVTVSGGISRSDLMGEILASVLGRPLERLQSEEGPALGAALTALAGLESYRRQQKNIQTPFTVADAVAVMVRFRDPVHPHPAWQSAYQKGLRDFEAKMRT
ncbi:MAG: xylulokinase [Gemmataceae bacterium]